MIRHLCCSLLLVSGLVASVSSAAASSQVRAHAPVVGGLQRELDRISVDSASDAWSLGDIDEGTSIVRHWDGNAWVAVPIHTPHGATATLSGIVAVGPNDVWIVGELDQDGGAFATLTEHWDGTAFSVVPSPNPDQASWLAGVSAVSSDDIWAVGGTEGPVSLTEHWDGTDWSVVQSPGGDYSDLAGVAAISSNDVWASGSYIDHWNGQRWKIVHVERDGYVDQLSADSSSDVWAVGSANDEGEPFVEHWNGARWKAARVRCHPKGVYPVAPDDVWVAASCGSGTREKATTFHWDGKTWHRISVPDPGMSSGLLAVDGSGPDDIWAVGGYVVNRHGSTVERPLYEHWDGSSWTVVRGHGPAN